jgi:hypothetical protein
MASTWEVRLCSDPQKFKGLHESVGVFFSCPRVYCKPPKFLQNESHSIRVVYPDDMGVGFTGMFNMFSPRSRIPVVDIGAPDDIIKETVIILL